MEEDYSNSDTNSAESPRTDQPGSLPTVWDHFTKLENDGLTEPRYECYYCGAAYSFGTLKPEESILWNHLAIECENNPGLEHEGKEDPGLETSCFVGDSLESRISLAKYIRGLTKMTIGTGLPLSNLDMKEFRDFVKELYPYFTVPSPITIARDAYRLYSHQKKQLKEMLIENPQRRVCLTTQTWTSVKEINYMALKVHFIDSNWELHKKILNFCVVPDVNEETVGEIIAACLVEWGIERVLTVSVDNVSANDAAINFMKMKLKNLAGNLLDGEFLHMPCYTRIVNSIVNESLRDMHESIDSIRNAVRYVKIFPKGLSKFSAFIEQEEIECECLMASDDHTRWNTTYLMLRDTLKFQRAFEKLEEDDEDYASYFLEDWISRVKLIGPPTVDDWENVRVFVILLKIFYDATLKFSASCVTSNVYFDTMCSIQSKLTTLSRNKDSVLGKMAASIKRKYYKYWGSLDSNKLLIVSVVLDPRFKLDYVSFCFSEIYDDSMVEEMVKGVKELLLRLYVVYSASDSTPGCPEASNDDDQCHDEWINKFLEFKEKKGLLPRNEVDKYLSDPCEDPADDKFDMLHWWKVHSTRYRILSGIARDVFAIPLTAMASSESAFSTGTGGCALNKHWSSYTPKFVQALMCSQDWLRTLPSSPVLVDDDETLIRDTQFYEELESGNNSNALNLCISSNISRSFRVEFFGPPPTTQQMDVDG